MFRLLVLIFLLASTMGYDDTFDDVFHNELGDNISRFGLGCAVARRVIKIHHRIKLLRTCEGFLPGYSRKRVSIMEVWSKEGSGTAPLVGLIQELEPVTGSFTEYLYRNLEVSDHLKVNTGVSPLALGLGLAVLGEWTGTNTQMQIYRVLRVTEHTVLPTCLAELGPLHAQDSESLKLITSIYVDKSYLPENPSVVAAYGKVFSTDIQSADFTNDQLIMENINKMVAKITEGHITDAVTKETVNYETTMVLVNTVYFKGEWEQPFRMQLGSNGYFYSSNQKLDATFMSRDPDYFHYKVEMDNLYSMLELPFNQLTTGPYSMIIILPTKRSGLAAVEKALTDDDSWIKEFDLESSTHTALVKPTIPRFTIDSTADLTSSLIKMGVTMIFEDKADFQGLTNKEKLKVSPMRQRVYMDINEKGSNTETTTKLFSPDKKESQEPVEFKADHPFIYALIQRETKTVLLMGHVMKPNYDELFGTVKDQDDSEPQRVIDFEGYATSVEA